MQTQAPPAPPAPPPNTQLGPYVLVDRIAVGGMAEVFRALEERAVGEPRVVVIKRMLPHIAAEEGAQSMFAEEARLGSHIVHPNVVQVIGHGEVQGKPYLTLEYVPGADLWKLNRWLMRRGQGLSHAQVVFVLQQLLMGLSAVHRAADTDGNPLGIVHRDVSPSNLLVSVHGEIKLADFGIARAKNPAAGTPAERSKGKLGYLAPEHVAGHEVGLAADLFSVGVIGAELLMRRPLFSGGSELAVLLSIRDAEIRPFIEIFDSLPEGLGETIKQALELNPDDRPQTAQAFANALAPFQTEDPEKIQTSIAALVHQMMDEDTTPRRRTSADDIPAATLPPEAPIDAAQMSGPTTDDMAPIAYTVHTQGGDEVGPHSYAEVIEMIATGKLGPRDRIKAGDEAFVEIASIEDLCRHIPAANWTPTTGQIAVSSPASQLSFTMADDGMVRALATTFVEKKTGLWLCEQGSVRKEVYTQNGVPTFVTSNLAGELLGEHLVNKGVIQRSELDMALAVMPRFEGKLGDTLVALGLVEPLELFKHIEDQVREKLLDLFTWTTGTVTFYGDVAPPMSGFPLRLDPWQILDAGIRRRIAAGLQAELLGAGDSMLVQAKRLPTSVATADFPDHLSAALQHAATPRPLRELVERVERFAIDDAFLGFVDVEILLALDALEWHAP